MIINFGGILIILDIIVSMFAAILGKYDMATFYIVLGIFYVLVFNDDTANYDSNENINNIEEQNGKQNRGNDND